MPSFAKLEVRSHVSRDILQSAAVFKHEWLVVWEYVANGLEYVDQGANRCVDVRVDAKAHRITVTDLGRGMTFVDLEHFFTMHGENRDRSAGKPGRGMFGTGKSAAFGIADTLRVTTVRNGRRSQVELRRADIRVVRSGDPVPVQVLEQEVLTQEPNHTRIEIEDINVKHIEQRAIIRYIERHIARWPNATVVVNGHVCEYTEPPIAEEYKFTPADPKQREVLGDVELVIRVAKGPLERDLQGITIYANGVWLETTLAGLEGKEMVHYLFGEIHVPALADDSGPISAHDLSRSMQLNRNHPVVQALDGFIGHYLDKVRRELVAAERERRASEEAKQLEREAQEIARIINDDFSALQQKLRRVRAAAAGSRDLLDQPVGTGDDLETLVPGDDVPARPTDDGIELGHGDGKGGKGGEPPDLGTPLQADAEVTAPTATRVPAKPRTRRAGGFHVEFRNMGDAALRAKYESEARTIFINLDHPQLRAALGAGGTGDPLFNRLAYEVAFAEYAIALAYERVAAGHFIELPEPLFDVRDTLDRVTRSAADLYAAAGRGRIV